MSFDRIDRNCVNEHTLSWRGEESYYLGVEKDKEL